MSKAYAVEGQANKFWQIKDADGQYCRIEDCRDNTNIQPLPEPGRLPASWPPGAQIFFTGNLLKNGDFRDFKYSEGDVSNSLHLSWTLQGGMQAQIDKATDDQVAVVVETSGEQDGWFSQTQDLEAFYALLEPPVNPFRQAVSRKWAHFGATIQAVAGEGDTLNLVLVQRDRNDRELDVAIHPYSIQSNPQHIHASQPITDTTYYVEIRFHLRQGSSARVKLDDAYILITDEE